MSRLRNAGKIIAQVILITALGVVVGIGAMRSHESHMQSIAETTFEVGKAQEQTFDLTLPKEVLKPSVGEAVASEESKTLPVIVLEPANTIVFNDVVTDESVSKTQLKLQEVSSKLAKDKEIILVLYTPGGSVSAGMQLLDSLNALPQKVKTLTIFSASMGFQFVQGLDERMIIPSGVLMSHRAAGGLEGEFGGEFDVRLNALRRLLLYMDSIAAKRMKMTVPEYQELIRDEYWIHGFEAVGDRAADKLVLARCGAGLTGTEKKEIPTFFGTFVATFSKCPLITGPLEVSLDNISEAHREEVSKYTTMLWSNPKEFYKTYIKTHAYEKVIGKQNNIAF